MKRGCYKCGVFFIILVVVNKNIFKFVLKCLFSVIYDLIYTYTSNKNKNISTLKDNKSKKNSKFFSKKVSGQN